MSCDKAFFSGLEILPATLSCHKILSRDSDGVLLRDDFIWVHKHNVLSNDV